MIASLTSLLTFIGIDGMGHVNGHNVDRSGLHQGKNICQLSFSLSRRCHVSCVQGYYIIFPFFSTFTR